MTQQDCDLTAADLHRRDRLISGTSLATQRLLTIPERNAAVSAALAALGEASEADRVVIFRNHPHPVTGAWLASQRWEWCRAGVAPGLEDLELQNVAYETSCPGWYVLLAAGQPLSLAGSSLAEPLHNLACDLNTARLLVLPISIRGQLWGFLSAIDSRGPLDWSESERSILHATASSIGGAIAHHQATAELQAMTARLESLVEQRTVKLRAAVQQLEQEVQDRRRAEAQLRYNALHDSLTGLPNRACLLETISQWSEHPAGAVSNSVSGFAQVTGTGNFALLFIDVDRFKSVNDTFGHQAGDELLVAIAHRLKRCLRAIDLLARLGSDEFAVLVRDVRSYEDAEAIAVKIHASLASPILLADREIVATVSIGIALGSPDYDHPESILRDADMFMRQAKAQGRSRSAVFDRAVQQRMLTSLRLENDLRRAIAQIEDIGLDAPPEAAGPLSQFRVLYQPIFDARDLCVRKFESLVRWTHPELGPIPPDRFIPIAEETGAIHSLGLWVLHQSCQQLSRWQESFPRERPLKIAVNLSGRQFSRLDLLDHIDGAINHSAILPGTLELELTESTIVENADLAAAILKDLQARKIILCMDDFGTGYSSLSYLHRFPLDVLKIDRSFTKRIDSEPEGRAIVSAILALAKHLNMQTVAEGVETSQQLHQLQTLGCDLVQGFLFSRPLDSTAVNSLLSNHHKPTHHYQNHGNGSGQILHSIDPGP